MFWDGFIAGVLVTLAVFWFTNHPLMAFIEMRIGAYTEYKARKSASTDVTAYGVD